MRASSWASTTTRRARSVNRSNMRTPRSPVGPRPLLGGERGTGGTTPRPAYAFHGSPQRRPLTANKVGPGRLDETAEGELLGGVEGLAHVAGDAAALGDLEA